jgi:glycerol-3-phosphate acyltransferase PlsX
VEGNAVLGGEANVIVCDAFVGNCMFKLAESGGPTVARHFLERMKKHRLIYRLLKGKVKGAVASLASSDSLSGGLIWGIDGIVFKMHGSSKSPEVVTALSHARKAVEGNVISCIKTELDKIQEHINI